MSDDAHDSGPVGRRVRTNRPAFGQVSREAVAALLAIDGEGRTAAIGFYLALSTYASSDGACFPSYDELARVFGLSHRSCKRGAAALRDAGLLISEQHRNDGGGFSSNDFLLIDPAYGGPGAGPPPGARSRSPA